MAWIDAAWLAGGLALGVVHATGLWRSSQRPSLASALWGAARLLVVGLALAAAALLGGILPTAAGWAGGFFAGVIVVAAASRVRIGDQRASE